jgi:hypothetical protein
MLEQFVVQGYNEEYRAQPDDRVITEQTLRHISELEVTAVVVLLCANHNVNEVHRTYSAPSGFSEKSKEIASA